MFNFPIITTNPNSSFFVNDLKQLQNEYDTKITLTAEDIQTQQKGIPLSEKVKQLRKSIEEFDGFKLEV